MKIGIISTNDISDKKVSSGTIYTMTESLKNIGNEVVWIKSEISFMSKLFNKFYSINKSPKRLFYFTFFGAKFLTKSINKKSLEKVDILFAPFSSGSIFQLKTRKPLIYLSDATFAAMIDYYDTFSNLDKKTIKEGNLIEQNALQKADKIIFSSDWAKESAIKDYGIEENKIKVIEFGANIDEKDINTQRKTSTNKLNLLFLGVEWKRKGGDIAIEACKHIIAQGIPCTINIVGIKNLSPEIENLDFVKNIGFLNKNNVEEYQQLVNIIDQSECLLLPTLAECAGVAFVESSAFGLPVFSHITGGVSNYVKDGINGYLLPLGSTGKDFGNKIIECYQNKELEKMSITAVELYKTKLNWKVWGEEMKKIIDDLV